ncbi:hypothetical protein BKA65DRAFT_457440 [Rhexocercosporidium sp. MPI-PUGE-AT-0058]|nr:hypothetical protein BKA65DRAFT_457440 [Rhexocercosporidium sp. MPI-PUGE-AT-0058]
MLTQNTTKPSSRKKRAHRKSRQGCGNCKLRKVKASQSCDESKPACKKCIAYSVLCDYEADSEQASLQLSTSGAFMIQIVQSPHPVKYSIQYKSAPILRFGNADGMEETAPYQLQLQDQVLLQKFQLRTVFTISNKNNVDIYQNEMIKLACSNPHLVHAILALTLMHDRFLFSPTATLSTATAFHWSQSVSLLKNKLSLPIRPEDRDPLWATAMCLGIISFFYIEATTPEEAWPLKPPCSTDLSWMAMFDGKSDVEIATEATATTTVSLFNAPFPNKMKIAMATKAGLDTLPPEFISLYDLNATSTVPNNPYIPAVRSLAKVLHLNDTLPIILHFLSFVRSMNPAFKELLKEKDSRALLVLAFWFAKLGGTGHWWLVPRAVVEGKAICMFLERECRREMDVDVVVLLGYLRVVFGEG